MKRGIIIEREKDRQTDTDKRMESKAGKSEV